MEEQEQKEYEEEEEENVFSTTITSRVTLIQTDSSQHSAKKKLTRLKVGRHCLREAEVHTADLTALAE